MLRRLELTVTHKLDGLLQGDHRGFVPGHGSELGETREYQPGDDVRRIDWNVTARTTVAHVRETVADRELETWLVVDQSASLDFGTAGCEKRDLVIAAAAAVGFLTARAGNRIGAVLLQAGTAPVVVPARTGRAHVQAVLHRVIDFPRRDGAGATDLGAGIDRLAAVFRRRGLAVVLSDFLGSRPAGVPPSAPSALAPWELPMRRLSVRHDVLAVEVLDPRELTLPDVGMLHVIEPESGRVREVATGDSRLRARYAAATAAQRTAIAAGLRSAGADHLQLRTDQDWLIDLVRFVALRRRRMELTPARRGAP
ncbi:MAG: DUF58 domain-containing protein [Acidimicrobiia bacterium]